MQVETYDQKEMSSDGIRDSDEETIELINELELTGQQELISSEGLVVPWRLLTKEETVIYGLLCPEKTELADYKEEAIPLRVLHIAKLAKPDFDYLFVLHPESSQIKDPVLIGVKGSKYSTDRYILARWGDHLAPLVDLAKQALQVWKSKIQSACCRIVAEATVWENRATSGTLTEVEMLAARGNTPSDFYLAG